MVIIIIIIIQAFEAWPSQIDACRQYVPLVLTVSLHIKVATVWCQLQYWLKNLTGF